MSFTCSWVLVQGVLDSVFDSDAPQQSAHAPAVFAPMPGGGSPPAPCEFVLELDETVGDPASTGAPAVLPHALAACC